MKAAKTKKHHKMRNSGQRILKSTAYRRSYTEKKVTYRELKDKMWSIAVVHWNEPKVKVRTGYRSSKGHVLVSWDDYVMSRQEKNSRAGKRILQHFAHDIVGEPESDGEGGIIIEWKDSYIDPDTITRHY